MRDFFVGNLSLSRRQVVRPKILGSKKFIVRGPSQSLRTVVCPKILGSKKFIGQTTALLYSCLIHLALILILIAGSNATEKTSRVLSDSANIIQASIVDPMPAHMPLAQAKFPDPQLPKPDTLAEKNKKLTVPLPPKAADVPAPTPAVQTAKESAELEKITQDLKQAKELEEYNLAKIQKAKEKEKKELEALRAQKIKAEKRLVAIDERRQEEQERATQMRLEREKEEKRKKQVAAVAAKRQHEEDQKQAAIESAENARLAAVASVREAALDQEASEHLQLVKDKIEANWNRPPGLDNLRCQVKVITQTGGKILDAVIIASSGNELFDSSARAAVIKAGSIPIQADKPELMRRFLVFSTEFCANKQDENDAL